MFINQKQFNWRLFVYTRMNLLLGIGVIIAGVMILALATWPQISSILETQTKIAKEKKELQKVSVKLQELDAIKISPEFKDTDTVNGVLPSKKPLLEFMTSLNSIASLTNVVISDLKISPGQIATASSELKTASRRTNKNSYDALDLNLAVSGQLNDIQRFLSLIEQISPITTITKIDLNREVKVNDGGSIKTKADLDLRVHYFTQQITTSLTTTLPQITQRERTIFKTIYVTLPVSDSPTKIEGGKNLLR
jgi:Tfp pilus assembly protein PilO